MIGVFAGLYEAFGTHGRAVERMKGFQAYPLKSCCDSAPSLPSSYETGMESASIVCGTPDWNVTGAVGAGVVCIEYVMILEAQWHANSRRAPLAVYR